MNKKILKQVTGMLVAGTMVFGLTGCAGASKDSASSSDAETEESTAIAETADVDTAADLKTLRIGVGGVDGGGILEGAALAVKNKYFEEELEKVGYQPEYIYFSGAGPEINEALAGDQIDAAIVGDFPTFTAKSNGIDTTIIAETNQKVNYGILTTVENAETIEDLKGKTAVVFGGSVSQFFWMNYLEKKGIDIDEIPYVNSTDATTLLNSGDAQVYPVTAYMAYYLESMGIGHVIDTADADIWTTFVFEVKSDLLKENDQLGVAINKALIRASKEAQENPQSQYDALASETVSAEAWEKYYAADPTLSNLSPEITEEIIAYYEKENQWMLDNGVISNPVDISTFVDTSYYERALQELEQ